MINEAKDGLENTLRNNDAIREEERIRAAADAITLSSDDNYNSETRDTSSEPSTSSNKASKFPSEHSTDKQSRSYISSVATMQTMNIYIYCLHNG